MGREVVVGHHEVAVRVRVAVHARVVVHREAAEGDRAVLLPGRRRCRGRVLRTLKDQVAAKLQTIGRRWATCPRPAIARERVPEIGQAAVMWPIARMQEPGLPEATLPIGRTQVLGQALAPVRCLEHDQQPAHDHQHAMCKIFLVCQMPAAGMLRMSALADHQVALVTWPRPQVVR